MNWPLVVLIIVVIFLIIFRKAINRLIDRISKADKSGLTFERPQEGGTPPPKTFSFEDVINLPITAQEKQGWVWLLGVTAGIYNPILRVHLTREIWSVVNVATILLAGTSIFVLTNRDK